MCRFTVQEDAIVKDADKLRELTCELLLAAGGKTRIAGEYFKIVVGGDDDVTGMLISHAQLDCWKALGDEGKAVWEQLSQYARDQEMAYGSYCYSAETIESILCSMSIEAVGLGPCDISMVAIVHGAN